MPCCSCKWQLKGPPKLFTRFFIYQTLDHSTVSCDRVAINIFYQHFFLSLQVIHSARANAAHSHGLDADKLIAGKILTKHALLPHICYKASTSALYMKLQRRPLWERDFTWRGCLITRKGGLVSWCGLGADYTVKRYCTTHIFSEMQTHRSDISDVTVYLHYTALSLIELAYFENLQDSTLKPSSTRISTSVFGILGTRTR